MSLLFTYHLKLREYFIKSKDDSKTFISGSPDPFKHSKEVLYKVISRADFEF